jgi:hypothetical protein
MGTESRHERTLSAAIRGKADGVSHRSRSGYLTAPALARSNIPPVRTAGRGPSSVVAELRGTAHRSQGAVTVRAP